MQWCSRPTYANSLLSEDANITQTLVTNGYVTVEDTTNFEPGLFVAFEFSLAEFPTPLIPSNGFGLFLGLDFGELVIVCFHFFAQCHKICCRLTSLFWVLFCLTLNYGVKGSSKQHC